MVPVCPNLFSVHPRMSVNSLSFSASASVNQHPTGGGIRLEFVHFTVLSSQETLFGAG